MKRVDDASRLLFAIAMMQTDDADDAHSALMNAEREMLDLVILQRGRP